MNLKGNSLNPSKQKINEQLERTCEKKNSTGEKSDMKSFFFLRNKRLYIKQ